MEGLDILLQYGLLGVFAVYMIKKETLWEKEKQEMTTKYESLLKEAVSKSTEISAKLSELSDAMQQCKGKS